MDMVQGMGRGARPGISGRVMLGISFLALASACGGGGGLGEDSGGPGGTVPMGPSTILPLVADARVDLPGKVSIFVQVLNVDGSPAADLAPEAFRIYENGQSVSLSESQQQLRPRPQVFRSYTHLIMDRSNSVQQNQAAIDAQKEGAGRYVDVVTAQSPESFIKLSWFDGQDHLHAIAGHDIGFTNDAIALNAAIDALDAEPPFSPSTNLYGAVIDALDDLDQVDAQAAAEGIENRSLALVTFTDGTHQAGPIATLDEAVARITQEDGDGQARYSAFTIGLGSEIDTMVLQAIGPDGAEFAGEIEDLVPLFEAVGAGVRALANSFYFLSYCSPKTIGSHQLRVSVRPSPATGDVTFPFDATFFGAGCGFLDVYTRPELAVGSQRVVLADSIEDDLGRVLVCGWRSNGCAEPGCGEVATAFVARFLADPEQPDPEDRLDGRLDPSFGNAGILLLTHAGLAVTGASAISLDPSDGALLVGGWSRANPLMGVGQASIWRVTSDGSSAVQVDMINPLGVDQVVHDVLVHGQGRLVAVGSRGGATRSSTVWSLDAASLAIDGGFGSGGVFVHPESPTQPFDVATDVALDGLGRVVVVGEGFSINAPSWNQNRDAKVLVLDALTGELDVSLRPQKFTDFVGQIKVRERLELAAEAARQRGDVLDHVMLSGPPGLGKTTLAYILSDAMGVNMKATSGPVIDKPGDLAGLLTSLERGDVLFIDEIHRMQKTVEEYLYSAMEDFVIDIMIDQGPNARSVRLELPHFTLVGATTRSGLTSAPLRSRFGIANRLDYYAAAELQAIIERSARILNVDIDEPGAAEISRRARGTPRIANNLLKRVRDYAQVRADNKIVEDVADRALAMLDIDKFGLDEMDKRVLETLVFKFGGGPVGLSSLAVSVSEEPDTIEDVYEPYLIQEGYLKRTPQGRVVTDLCYKRLGLEPAAQGGAQPQLRL